MNFVSEYFIEELPYWRESGQTSGVNISNRVNLSTCSIASVRGVRYHLSPEN